MHTQRPCPDTVPHVQTKRIDFDAILATRHGGHAPRLAVCYIWQSPFLMTRAAESLLALERPAGWTISFHRGTGWGPACRHIDACDKALKAGADWILILGADQVYEPDLLCRITARLSEGYETCAALVPTRGFVTTNEGMRPFQRMAWRFKPANEGMHILSRAYRGQQLDGDMIEIIDPDAGEMQQVTCIGSGVLCFHRDHLLALKKPWFYESIDHETQQRYACMDTTFTFRLGTEAGATIWVDTTINVRHLHLFAIDPSFSERFADWAVPAPSADMDICRYLPTAVPHSTIGDDTTEPASRAVLPSSFFDRYRRDYATMPYAEHQQAYSLIERAYPDQSCYNRQAVAALLSQLLTAGVSPSVLELGGWKGELAHAMLDQFRAIRLWHNIELCREAVEKTVCKDIWARYTCQTLGDFFWNSKPNWIQMYNTLILSHVVEHMRLEDFAGTMAHCAAKGIDYLYLDIPHITEASHKTWHGWTNTHILEGGWQDLEAILARHGYDKMSGESTPRCYASQRGMLTLRKEQIIHAFA